MKKGKKVSKNITINISNRWMYTILAFMILILGVAVVNSAWSDISPAPTTYHDANEIKVLFGETEYTLQEVIGLIGTSSSGANDIWNKVGENAHYSLTGRVGIGTDNPTKKLVVEGDISANELFLDGRRIWFNDEGKLCYDDEITYTCGTPTQVSCSASPLETSLGRLNLWNCEIYPDDSNARDSAFKSACAAYCTSSGKTDSEWVASGFPLGIEYIDDYVYNVWSPTGCNGVLKPDCGSTNTGTKSQWQEGRALECDKGGLICECYNPSTYLKENIIYSGQGIVCI
jgi:hypothetical protein